VAACDDSGVVSVYDVSQLYDFPPDGSNPLKSDPASLASLPVPPMPGSPAAAEAAEANGCGGGEPHAATPPPPKPLSIQASTALQGGSKPDEASGRLRWAVVPGTELLACCSRNGAVHVYNMALDGMGAVASSEVPAAARSPLNSTADAPPFCMKVRDEY
jgi:hypothetical protein